MRGKREDTYRVSYGIVQDNRCPMNRQDALERFARKRDTIESEQAVVLNAALIEAIDRLNAVAERIAATADQSAKDAAE